MEKAKAGGYDGSDTFLVEVVSILSKVPMFPPYKYHVPL